MTRADSEGEEPREEIILPSLGSGVKKLIVAEDDKLNVGSFEDKAVKIWRQMPHSIASLSPSPRPPW